nr:uncharacterized protein LOC113821725 [Penaeus vannamei]
MQEHTVVTWLCRNNFQDVVEVVLGTALAILLYLSFFQKPKGLPPGRWGLPLIGYLPLNGKSIEEQATLLRKQYGDIFLWRMGTQVVVFVNNFKLTKEVFASKSFTDRPGWDMITLEEKVPLGVFASNGHIWQTNRRFTLRQLRDQGMGKSRLVSGIHVQARKLVEALKDQAGRSAPLPHALRVGVTNVIWHMIAGKTFEIGDEKLIEFERIIKELNDVTFWIGIPDFFPWLKYLPKVLQNKLFSLDVNKLLKEKFFVFFNETIQEHKASLDPNNPRDLMDAYLLDIEQTSDDPDSIRTKRDLVFLLIDLFFAGSETTTNTLTHLFYYMAMNPDIQKKVQAEIDEVLPKGTLPTLDDRPSMPYTDAVIHEILRITSLVPLGVMHCANEDTQLSGYSIPKGTIITSAFSHIHFDSRHWEQAEKFMPERWLDQEGKFNGKRDGFVPFGIGRRSCLGETLARMELFIFSTAVFQSLNIAPPPGTALDLAHDDNQPFFHNAKTQDVYVTVRCSELLKAENLPIKVTLEFSTDAEQEDHAREELFLLIRTTGESGKLPINFNSSQQSEDLYPILGVFSPAGEIVISKVKLYEPITKQGRWGLPLVGYIPLSGKHMDEQFKDLQKQHGDIYLWRMGTQVMVFLHSYQLSKEALGSSAFLDRPTWELFKFMEPVTLGEESCVRIGVIGSNGNIWHTNRRFSLRQLRDQGGMGKSSLVSAIQKQARELVEALKGQASKPERIPGICGWLLSTLSGIWLRTLALGAEGCGDERDRRLPCLHLLCFASHVLLVRQPGLPDEMFYYAVIPCKQFEKTDPKLQEFIDIIDDLTQKFGPIAIPDFMPWIKYCLPDFLIRRLFSIDMLYTLKDKFFDYCKELIEEHKASLDPDDPKDLIDGYLLDIEASKDDPDTIRTGKDLCILILDLFFAGSETTVGTLAFMFFYLANHPEVQRKFQAEIDEVLPKGTLATLEDRSRMPFTEAVIHEVLRASSLASLGVQHVAVRDTMLGGYLLPKGTIVSTAAGAMHHDPRYWNNPEKFMPERWLDDQGKFTTKKEGFLPFGIGKRVCVGESLARMELFIISTAIFQSLSVSPPPGSKVDVSPDPGNPFGHNPRQEKVCFTIRE